MRVMLLAFLAVILIGIGANYALKEVGFSTEARNSGSAVRLDDKMTEQ